MIEVHYLRCERHVVPVALPEPSDLVCPVMDDNPVAVIEVMARMTDVCSGYAACSKCVVQWICEPWPEWLKDVPD